MSGNQKCDDETDDDADGQHDPYVSAMLRRRHNKMIAGDIIER